MWIELLAGLATALSAVALALALRTSAQLKPLEAALAAAQSRALAQAADLRRQQDAMTALLQTQALAQQVVGAGTAVVQEIHRTISSIPFDVLEALPGTREGAKVARKVHDAIAGGVYGAISGLNTAIGRELRKGLGAAAERTAAVASPMLQEPAEPMLIPTDLAPLPAPEASSPAEAVPDAPVDTPPNTPNAPNTPNTPSGPGPSLGNLKDWG